uniref:THAP-type domain-containing protein n=1 Tax=Parasteatoda tepidariorum TaxID=114398 RepID=A0A2L2YN14_PARTP
MPYHCCAVNCKGNYANGPKVAVFNFPKDEAQQRRWLQALSRKDFIITKNSRVCEKHFSSDVIVKETVKTDPKTGEIKQKLFIL